MPRDLRIEYPDAMYQVMNRGDHRKNIFFDEADRRLFLDTLGQACRKTDWQVHAYCLMRNHFHLVIETPRANLEKDLNAKKKADDAARKQVGECISAGAR